MDCVADIFQRSSPHRPFTSDSNTPSVSSPLSTPSSPSHNISLRPPPRKTATSSSASAPTFSVSSSRTRTTSRRSTAPNLPSPSALGVLEVSPPAFPGALRAPVFLRVRQHRPASPAAHRSFQPAPRQPPRLPSPSPLAHRITPARLRTLTALHRSLSTRLASHRRRSWMTTSFA